MSLTTFEIQDFARPVYAVKFPVLKCMDGVSQSHFILIFFNFTNPQSSDFFSENIQGVPKKRGILRLFKHR